MTDADRICHALHVSLIHRRMCSGRPGDTMKLNVWSRIDRKLSFYTDFLHVPVVTGKLCP
jgi:hypothetical protein